VIFRAAGTAERWLDSASADRRRGRKVAAEVPAYIEAEGLRP